MSITKLNMNKKTKVNCKICFQYKQRLINEICYECSSCAGKEQYGSSATARSVANWFYQSREYEYLYAYKCVFCKKYHLGHNKYSYAS